MSSTCPRCTEMEEKKVAAKEKREQGREAALQRKAHKLEAKAQKIIEILSKHNVASHDVALVTALVKLG